MTGDPLTIEEARSFRDPDGTYMAALNDPTVFEALCSDVNTISLLIDVLAAKVDHLQGQLKNRESRIRLELLHTETDEQRIVTEAEHDVWKSKVEALLRSTIFHLRQAWRRADRLLDDPIRSLKEAQRIMESGLPDDDVFEALEELFERTLTAIADKKPTALLEGWEV